MRHAQRVAELEFAGGERAGVAAKIGIRAAYRLHRKDTAGLRRTMNVDGVEMFDQRWPVIPRHGRRSCCDVIAAQRTHRDDHQRLEAKLSGIASEVAFDRTITLLIVAEQVHLVDGEHHVLQAHQRDEIRMSPCLNRQTRAGIDQQNRKVCG